MCFETASYEIRGVPEGILIDWISEFSSPHGDFTFGDQEEMGLGVRVATPLAVDRQKGGRILDAQGRRNGAGVWGKAAPWCDYGGRLDGKAVGLLVLSDTANFRMPWWHARDYGLLVANPFGRNAMTRGEKSRIVVKKGEVFRLRFGVLVYSRDSDDLDRAAFSRRFLAAGDHRPGAREKKR